MFSIEWEITEAVWDRIVQMTDDKEMRRRLEGKGAKLVLGGPGLLRLIHNDQHLFPLDRFIAAQSAGFGECREQLTEQDLEGSYPHFMVIDFALFATQRLLEEIPANSAILYRDPESIQYIRFQRNEDIVIDVLKERSDSANPSALILLPDHSAVTLYVPPHDFLNGISDFIQEVATSIVRRAPRLADWSDFRALVLQAQ